jgi:hypothetical protein
MSLAVYMWTHQLRLGPTVLVVHFTFMSKETARVRKALELRALGMLASIWPIVLVHVFAAFDVSIVMRAID